MSAELDGLRVKCPTNFRRLVGMTTAAYQNISTDATAQNALAWKPPSQTRVVVAMSGGVTAQSRLLCSRPGLDVIGIHFSYMTMVLPFRPRAPVVRVPTSMCAYVARLGIPHMFWITAVLMKGCADFADITIRGQTPIPMRCNENKRSIFW